MLHFDSQNKGSRWVLIAVAAAILIALVTAVGSALYFSRKYDDLKKTHQSSDANEQSQKRALINKVKKLYETPDEDPSVIRVDDKSKINSQEFFAKAENGDVVFVYKESKLAILYRESTDKIINTGPIALDEENGSANVNTDSLNSTTGQ